MNLLHTQWLTIRQRSQARRSARAALASEARCNAWSMDGTTGLGAWLRITHCCRQHPARCSSHGSLPRVPHFPFPGRGRRAGFRASPQFEGVAVRDRLTVGSTEQWLNPNFHSVGSNQRSTRPFQVEVFVRGQTGGAVSRRTLDRKPATEARHQRKTLVPERPC